MAPSRPPHKAQLGQGPLYYSQVARLPLGRGVRPLGGGWVGSGLDVLTHLHTSIEQVRTNERFSSLIMASVLRQ